MVNEQVQIQKHLKSFLLDKKLNMKKDNIYFKNFLFTTYMKKGKKSKSEKLFFNLFSYAQENRYKKIRQVEDLKFLVYSNAPILTTRRKKFGRFFKQIPFLMNSKSSLKIPVKFLFKDLNKKVNNPDKRKNLLRLLIELQNKRGTTYENLNSLRANAVRNIRNYKYQW